MLPPAIESDALITCKYHYRHAFTPLLAGPSQVVNKVLQYPATHWSHISVERLTAAENDASMSYFS